MAADTGNPIDSLSTDPSDVLKDYASQAMQDLQGMDRVPQTWGANSPMFGDGPATEDSVTSYLQQGFRAQRASQGGAATDTPLTPTGADYTARRTNMLKAEEGIRPAAYDDKTGMPVASGAPLKGKTTVGVGFNMDKPGAQQEWDAAFQGNGPDFDAVRTGKQNLTPPQITTLTNYSAKMFDDIVSQKTAGLDLSEHQRLALVSLAYNGSSLLGPVVSAMRSGDMAGATQAIKDIPLNPGRRQREAALFAGI